MNKKIVSIFSMMICCFMFLAGCGDGESKVFTAEDIEYCSNWESIQSKYTIEEDVEYKQVGDTSLCVDILTPKIQLYQEFPVAIFYHGGSFTSGSKSDLYDDSLASSVNALFDLGYVIISADYTLCNGTTNLFPQNIEDVKDVVRWVYKNAHTYLLDTNRIGVIGASAGAHLALMTAYTSDTDFVGDDSLKDYSSKVQWVIDIFGPTDFYDFTNYYDTTTILAIIKQYCGYDINPTLYEAYKPTIKGVVDNLSPITYVKSTTVPTFIMHGKSDTIVPYSQSTSLEAKLQLNNVKVDSMYFENTGHELPHTESEYVSMLVKVKQFIYDLL